MKLDPDTLRTTLLKTLQDTLRAVPALRIVKTAEKKSASGTETSPIRLVVRSVTPRAVDTPLMVECRPSGHPAVARAAIASLARWRKQTPNGYPIFGAPYISQNTVRLCASEGVGTLDLSGNCRLAFGAVFIERVGPRNEFSERRELRSLYSPRSSRAIRVLLANTKKYWGVQELSLEANVSLGLASMIKQKLMSLEWGEIKGRLFRLSAPEDLLAGWAATYTFRRNQSQDYYTMKSIAEVESGLAEACREQDIPYALTGFSGAARLAPAVRYQRVMAFVDRLPAKVQSALGLKEVSSGANVTLLAPYDPGVYYGARNVDEVRIASPVQIYLDLVGFRGRGEEAAQVLLEKVIRPTW